VRVGALLATGFGYEWVVMVVVMGVGPRKLGSDLLKRPKPKVVGWGNSMKQYVKSASADSAVLQLR
jgi:hypothetical protein